ncbi:probable glucan endo-1,3-beta-glucosidase BG4 [Syzygium oleosum]|uniref:probable glucan endo-1,3-beta-glucosidase BG4 n=1 Tax=Syzygium oleosum TaxID=219896 RepID=UPI0024BACEA3|nr:probable glucan endo-1,3-beta-glucosidase BG4 [Syzygium oleosum]
MSSTLTILLPSLLALLHYHIGITEAQLDIGVNYGMAGDSLPSPATVVQLFKKYRIQKVRLLEPNSDVLEALEDSGIDVTLGIKNEDLPSIASNATAAERWFNNHVEPYIPVINFQYITAGNEVVPGDLAQYVLPAMQNIQNIINSYEYDGLRVSTVVGTATLGSLDPPSSGAFADEARADMVGIINFLSNTSSPLLVNVYPYFAFASDPNHVRLDYVQFTATSPLVQDGKLSYSNMLDAIVDAFYWAMEKEGVSYVDAVVSESGWPSDGGGLWATPQLAKTYNQHFVKKFLAKQATPKRPDRYLEGFIYTMFNENQKPSGVDQHWGLFYPDGTPVYPLFS